MITVAGYSPSLDVTYLVDALVAGRIHRPEAVVRCAGGKALNMARAAATLGAEACLVGILGGHTGRFIAEALAASGVEVRVVDTPAETRTCVSIAAADAAELTEIYEHATEVPPAVWATFVDELTDALSDNSPSDNSGDNSSGSSSSGSSSPGWLSVSGAVPRGLPADAIARLVEIAAGLGIRTAIDTHSFALPAAVEAGPDLVKVNRAEAAQLLARPVEDDLVAMARAIADRTGGLVVLTDGRDGSIAVRGADALRIHAPDVVGRYPVGSGDSYLGGLVHSLDTGADLPQALRTATACGIANALVPGPGRFTAESVAEILPQIEITKAT